MSTTRFSDLSLHPSIQKAIDERGFDEATEIQAKAIPLTRSGVDILAQSQTGTGKTLAFAIPALERIDPDNSAIQVLILSPTRELAQQCADEVSKLAVHMPHIYTANIFGGSDYRAQFRALRKANIVIGTPGRIMDHIDRGSIKLHNLEMIVLDEADEMLNMGFKEDVETILTDAAETRQTVLFSATIPKGILEIARQFQKDPVQINVTQNKTVLSEIKQKYVDVPKQYKNRALTLLLHELQPKRSIIFTNTKSMVDELTQSLCDEGFLAQGLHGDMKQSQRSTVMAAFKGGNTEILVATDVAARGIDVRDIDYVFNYDLPQIAEYYVHRIGRTGRAGRTGTAITLCCGNLQLNAIRTLAKKTQSTIEEMKIPTRESILKQQQVRNIEKVRLELEREPSEQCSMMMKQLLKEGVDPVALAAALMNLSFRASELQIEDIPATKIKKRQEIVAQPVQSVGHKKTMKESGFDVLLFDIGHYNKCSPNHLVGAITEYCGISSKYIGKIKIEESHSYVSIATEYSPIVLEIMNQTKICGKRIQVTGSSEEPKKDKPSRRSSRGDRHPRRRSNKGREKRPDNAHRD